MRRGIKFLLLVSLLTPILFPPVVSASGISMKDWQVESRINTSANNSLVILYLTITNNNESVTATGFKVTLNADSVEYIPEVPLEKGLIRLEDEEKVKLPEVSVVRSDGKSIISTTFPDPVLSKTKAYYKLMFITGGMIERVGEGYNFMLQFEDPKAVLENGGEVPLETSPGTIRVHVPVGYRLLSFEPSPWRIIWQGVGGYEKHFVMVYDTIPLPERILVSFGESDVVRKAIDVDEEIMELNDLIKTKKERGEEVSSAEGYISTAKIHLGRATAQLISGIQEEADVELEGALEYMQKTRASLGLKVPTMTNETVSPVDAINREIPRFVILAIVSIILIGGLILVKLGG